MWRSKIKTFIIVVLMSGFIWVLAERQITQTDEVDVRVVLPAVRNDKFYEFLDDAGAVMPERMQTVRLQVEGPIGVIQKALNRQPLEFEIPSPPKDTQEYDFGVVNEILSGRVAVEDGVLNVLDAEPPAIRVRERALVKRSLPIVVRSRPNNDILKAENLVPNALEVMCLPSQPEEVTIFLTAEQQRLAQKQSVKTLAEVRIGNVTISEHPMEVRLTQAPGLETAEIRLPRLGLLRAGRKPWTSKVVIDPKEFDKPALTNPIHVRGSAAAVKAYRDDVPYHLILVLKENEETDKLNTGLLEYYISDSLRNELTIENPIYRTISYRLETVSAPTTPTTPTIPAAVPATPN